MLQESLRGGIPPPIDYCNIPDKVKDQKLPSTLVTFLRQHTNGAALPKLKLMSSSGIRYFAIAKVMNQTLVGFAFRREH